MAHPNKISLEQKKMQRKKKNNKMDLQRFVIFFT